MVQQFAQQKSMMPADASLQSLLQLWNLVPQFPLSHLRKRWLSCSPFTIASSIAAPEAPNVSVATEASLILASSNTFWMRLAMRLISCARLARYRVRSR